MSRHFHFVIRPAVETCDAHLTWRGKRFGPVRNYGDDWSTERATVMSFWKKFFGRKESSGLATSLARGG
jgi:hypothetical protein